MNFYGQMPDMYSLVVNTCQPAVKRILKDAEESVESVVRPIRDEIESFNSQISDLRKRLEDKDADKEAINKQVSDLETEVGKSREKEEVRHQGIRCRCGKCETDNRPCPSSERTSEG